MPVKQPTLDLVADVGQTPDGYQGNWIPHRLRDAIEDGVFFVGDSAGHCLPTTAEGIRPALIFGALLGDELRAVVEGRQTADAARAATTRSCTTRTASTSSASTASSSRSGTSTARSSTASPASSPAARVSLWAFGKYLNICHPDLVGSRAGHHPRQDPSSARLMSKSRPSSP